MLFQVIAMSVITLLLFFLLLTRKPGRINLLLGACTTVCGIASMVLFILFQRKSGPVQNGTAPVKIHQTKGNVKLWLLLDLSEPAIWAGHWPGPYAGVCPATRFSSPTALWKRPRLWQLSWNAV